MPSPDTNDLFSRLVEGDVDALGALLQQYRPHLRCRAGRNLDARIHARVDPSDVVQQTLLEAYRDFAKFRGRNPAELVAWLRRVLDHNVAETIQHHLVTQKRTAHREQPLPDSRQASSAGQPGKLAVADASTPSQQVLRAEAVGRLRRAMQELPESQREAIRLRHLEGWSLREMADHFQRSETAVAGLLKRGLRQLRAHFSDTNPSPRV